MQTFGFKTDITDDPQGKKARMTFSGYLTLQNAREIRSVLQNHTGDYKSVELMAKDVSGIDVSFLQILESFRKTLEEQGKNIKIFFDLPYDLKNLLANAGIAYPVK